MWTWSATSAPAAGISVNVGTLIDKCHSRPREFPRSPDSDVSLEAFLEDAQSSRLLYGSPRRDSRPLVSGERSPPVPRVAANKIHFSFPFHRLSRLHSFYTTGIALCRCVSFSVPHMQLKREMFRIRRLGFALPVILRVNHRGKFGACPVCRCPGLRPPRILLSRRMEALNLILKRELQARIVAWHF